jgi:CBS domain-containing protein
LTGINPDSLASFGAVLIAVNADCALQHFAQLAAALDGTLLSPSSAAESEVPMKVKDAMHVGAEWLSPSTPLKEVACKMRDLDIGAIPIGENDRLVGMVTDRDITCRAVANGGDFAKMTARDVMTKNIVFCRDSEELDDAIRIMEQKQLRRLPVINEHKRMVGMLSLGDVSHALPRQTAGQVVAAVTAHHT